MAASEHRRTPFHTHQCLWSHPDGSRCRAYAEHNKYFCCQHSNAIDPNLRIVFSAPFHLPPLDSAANIQQALTLVASRLAIRALDDTTAKLILKAIHYAIKNLATLNQDPANPIIPTKHPEPPTHPVILTERSESKDPEAPQVTTTSQPSPTANPIIPTEHPEPATHPVILSERSESKDPEARQVPTTAQPSPADNAEAATEERPTLPSVRASGRMNEA